MLGMWSFRSAGFESGVQTLRFIPGHQMWERGVLNTGGKEARDADLVLDRLVAAASVHSCAVVCRLGQDAGSGVSSTIAVSAFFRSVGRQYLGGSDHYRPKPRYPR